MYFFENKKSVRIIIFNNIFSILKEWSILRKNKSEILTDIINNSCINENRNNK